MLLSETIRIDLAPLERRDCARAARIDWAAFGGLPHGDPWTQRDYDGVCRRNVGRWAVRAYWGDSMFGVLVWLSADRHYELLRLAVDPTWQRLGVGELLLAHLAKQPCYRTLGASIPEQWTGAALLLRAVGFSGRLVRGEFGRDDGYRFVYTSRRWRRRSNTREKNNGR